MNPFAVLVILLFFFQRCHIGAAKILFYITVDLGKILFRYISHFLFLLYGLLLFLRLLRMVGRHHLPAHLLQQIVQIFLDHLLGKEILPVKILHFLDRHSQHIGKRAVLPHKRGVHPAIVQLIQPGDQLIRLSDLTDILQKLQMTLPLGRCKTVSSQPRLDPGQLDPSHLVHRHIGFIRGQNRLIGSFSY